MAKKNTVKVGNTKIEISDLMDRMVDQVRKGADGEILEAMEDYQAQLMETASATWPVGRERKALPGEPTGPGSGKVSNPRAHSVNLFEKHTAIDSQGISVSVVNTANWAWAVRFGREALSGQAKGRRAWTELVSKPGKKGGAEIADSMTQRLVDLAKKTPKQGR